MENGKSISIYNLAKKVVNGERPKFDDRITNPMQELISRCWDKEPSNRPSFDEIFNELSANFSLLDEDVDEDEIMEYLDYLKDGQKEETVSSERKLIFILNMINLLKGKK